MIYRERSRKISRNIAHPPGACHGAARGRPQRGGGSAIYNTPWDKLKGNTRRVQIKSVNTRREPSAAIAVAAAALLSRLADAANTIALATAAEPEPSAAVAVSTAARALAANAVAAAAATVAFAATAVAVATSAEPEPSCPRPPSPSPPHRRVAVAPPPPSPRRRRRRARALLRPRPRHHRRAHDPSATLAVPSPAGPEPSAALAGLDSLLVRGCGVRNFGSRHYSGHSFTLS